MWPRSKPPTELGGSAAVMIVIGNWFFRLQAQTGYYDGSQRRENASVLFGPTCTKNTQ